MPKSECNDSFEAFLSMIEIKGQENIRQVGNLRNSAIFALRKHSDEADWNQFPQRHRGK